MARWTIIRGGLVLLAFLVAALGSQAAMPMPGDDTPAWSLLVVFGIVGLLFIIGMQRMNPWSASIWRYPAWSINPFLPSEPLQFFHFGGHFMLASAAGAVLRHAVLRQDLRVIDAMPVAFGLGIVCGVRVCTLAFRSKMAPQRG